THVAAQRRLETLMWEAAEAFGDLDGWISPTCPCLPMPISEVTDAKHLKQAMLPSQNTQAANLYGICAISTPIHHFGADLPVGLQVMCPAGYDSQALAIGMAMEAAFGPAPKPDLGAFIG
ncbi:MAG: amidase family protein, partial [Thalassobaculaceae bacterium]